MSTVVFMWLFMHVCVYDCVRVRVSEREGEKESHCMDTCFCKIVHMRVVIIAFMHTYIYIYV